MMDYYTTEKTLEEGRNALSFLEKQLKGGMSFGEVNNNLPLFDGLQNFVGNDSNMNENFSIEGTGSSKQLSTGNNTGNDRKLLDQVPRGVRLNQRLESLGLTVEELDDRGLLDGGGSVPSYYTSMKQKSRRQLELQPRSYRLQERGKEPTAKLLVSLSHMLRLLTKRGLNIETYCKQNDPQHTGFIEKRQFNTLLRKLGLPYSPRGLNEIIQHYTLPNTEKSNYMSFLRDSKLLKKKGFESNGNEDMVIDDDDDDKYDFEADISSYTNVLIDVKRMLLQSIKSLNKHPDDVYRMFARWDTLGSGTVTATQFLRVLSKLHIQLSDNDQDFLVELLDTNSMGRIDFESLLSYCFSSSTLDTDVLTSPMASMNQRDLFLDDNGIESLSAVSADANNSVNELKSQNSISVTKRPHTASLSRPYHNNNEGYTFQTSLQNPIRKGQLEHVEMFSNVYQRPIPSLSRAQTFSHGVNTIPLASPKNSMDSYDHTEVKDKQSKEVLPQSNIHRKLSGPGAIILTGQHNILEDIQRTNRPKTELKRPLTAAPRVGSQPQPVSTMTTNQNATPSQYSRFVSTNHPSNSKSSSINRTSNQTYQDTDNNYVKELPDDVDILHDLHHIESNYYVQQEKELKIRNLKKLPHENGSAHPSKYQTIPGHPGNEMSPNKFNYETESIHENQTLITDYQDEFNFGSVHDIPAILQQPPSSHNGNALSTVTNGASKVRTLPPTALQPSPGGGGYHASSLDGLTDSSQSSSHQMTNHFTIRSPIINTTPMVQPADTNAVQERTIDPSIARSQNGNRVKSQPPIKEPMDHLVLLANQILSTVREIITTRYRRGKSLRELYQHFDRNNRLGFDAKDFVKATSDLRIETSERVAAIAIRNIALDGFDVVSFGEFKVFLLDSDHKLLEVNIQEQLAHLLQQQGREYQLWMIDIMFNEEESLEGSKSPRSNGDKHDRAKNEFVHSLAFANGLSKIGAVLTPSEISRLVDRFNIHGNDQCSVSRFVRMIHNSRAWRHAEKVLAYQDEAIEEAEYLREYWKTNKTRTDGVNDAGLPEYPDELISMCEYLGIRILSEPNMVWIAADALKAPLPVSWTAQKDSNGRTYFYNHISNQSKWEHPLDPHFRKLRDKYRQSANDGMDIEFADHRDLYSHAFDNTTVRGRGQSALQMDNLFQRPPAETTNFSQNNDLPSQHNSHVNQKNAPSSSEYSKASHNGHGPTFKPQDLVVLSHFPDTEKVQTQKFEYHGSAIRPVSAPANNRVPSTLSNASSNGNELEKDKSNHPHFRDNGETNLTMPQLNSKWITEPGNNFEAINSTNSNPVLLGKTLTAAVYNSPYLKFVPVNNYMPATKQSIMNKDASEPQWDSTLSSPFANSAAKAAAALLASHNNHLTRAQSANKAANKHSSPNLIPYNIPQINGNKNNRTNSANPKKVVTNNNSSSSSGSNNRNAPSGGMVNTDNGLSVVDRALGYKKKVQDAKTNNLNGNSLMNSMDIKNRNLRLAEMMDGDIISKLDNVVKIVN